MTVTLHSCSGRADNNSTNELYSSRMSRQYRSDKCWCHVTWSKDECFSNFMATSACVYIPGNRFRCVFCFFSAEPVVLAGLEEVTYPAVFIYCGVGERALWVETRRIDKSHLFSLTKRDMTPGAHYWGYCCGTISLYSSHCISFKYPSP